MKIRLLIWIIPFASAFSAYAQKLIPVDSISTTTPQQVSIDRTGHLYVGDLKGTIRKYTDQLDLVTEYSPQKRAQASLIEAWNPLRPFIFYEHFQEYLFLNRFLIESNRFEVQSITSYAGLITISADNNLWVVDLVDFGLKKFNIAFGQTVIQRSFDLLLDPNNYDISFIREYQNMVFLADRYSGILVFDSLGNYLFTLPYTDVSYFGFQENNIYFLQGNELMFIDFYTQKLDIQYHITNKVPVRFALATANMLYVLDNKWIKKYRISR